ncbi:MAG: T9SS type A sorting domain-containing protein [Ignavibacteria bacterium]|nr:T9SS type A sorting domain-containing protein [Ignavibacteria bacterium]
MLYSNFGDVQELTEYDPPNEIEQLVRINASDTDAVPPPAYLFKDYVQQDTIYHPKLLLFNRGDRDFQKYRIYKMNWVTYHYYLFDSTTADSYIDTIERFLYSNYDPSDPPPDNLFYYVVAVDNSNKVSLPSDTIAYPAYVCPLCVGEIGPRGVLANEENTELPLNYSINNYPNPFNPSTKIFYTLPLEGIVKISVYNSLGQKVKDIVNEFKNAGSYSAEFNGSGFASGIYYYRLEAGSFFQSKKMMLLK